ncbi:MAG: hypothetical protein JWO82_1603, partial [Akkermansiaceae bacterium]|nr:hypothetical protein [Akkermansiaceae bacterium]
MKIHPAFIAAALLAWPAAVTGKPDQAPEKQQRQQEEKDSTQIEAEGLISGKTRWPKDGERAQEKASGLAIQLILKDPAFAATLWASFLKHVDQEMKAAGTPDPATLEQLHSSLLQDLAETAVTFPALMQFLAKIDRDPVSENLGTWETSLGRAFSKRYAAFPQVMEEVPEQYLFQTDNIRKLVRFFQATAKETPEEARPVLAAYALYQCFTNYQFQEYWNDRHAAVKWADSTLGPLHPLLADAMVIVILTSDHSRLDAQQTEDLRVRTQRLTSAPELAAIERASALTQSVDSSSHDKYDRPETVKAMAKTMSDFISPKRNLAGRRTIQYLSELTDYSSLSKEDAVNLSTKLRTSRLATEEGGEMDAESRKTLDRVRLNLAMKGGNPGEIAAAVKAAGAEVHGRLEMALKLWQAGQGGLAAGLIAGPDEYLVKAGNYFIEGLLKVFVPPKFTREIETGLPGWLETIPDREQRFRMECVISSLVDAKEAAAQKETREARLSRLVDRFAAEGPQAKAARMVTLAALSFSDAKGILLRDEMDKLVSDLEMGKLMTPEGRGGLSEDGACVA